MTNLATSTKYRYTRQVRRLAAHFAKSARELTQAQVDQYDAYFCSQYAPSTVNAMRAAINEYYTTLNLPIRLQYRAVNSNKLPDRMLSRAEVGELLSLLPEFYTEMARIIYDTPKPPAVVCKMTPSQHGGCVSKNTLRVKLREATAHWDNGNATPYTLYQAGIVHALQNGRDWREVAQAAGMEDSTIQRYIKLAQANY